MLAYEPKERFRVKDVLDSPYFTNGIDIEISGIRTELDARMKHHRKLNDKKQSPKKYKDHIGDKGHSIKDHKLKKQVESIELPKELSSKIGKR